MAKKRKRHGQRDNQLIAKQRLLPRTSPPRSTISPLRADDRRLFNPGLNYPRSLTRVAVIAASQRKQKKGRRRRRATGLSFVTKRLSICERRRNRRQVLHARGVAGAKGLAKRRVRNAFSSIICRS